MSISTLNFSATLPPFNYTSGHNNNYSNSNLSATGDVALNTFKDTSGATKTTVTSSINSNGVNYAENSATLNGNTLTVNYTSSTVPKTIETNLNGNGVDFTPQSSTINGNAVTTAYDTAANSNFGLAVPNAATSTGTSDTGQNIVLKSLSVVGNSLTATYELTTDLPNNVTLAPNNAPPPEKATVTALETSAVNLEHTGASFNTGSIQDISDVLANNNGIDFGGNLATSIQPAGLGPSTGFSSSNATLAAVLNPNSNLSPSASLSVSDFIDTGLTTFQTGSSNAASNNSGAFTSGGNGNNNANTGVSSPFSAVSSDSSNSPSPATSAGVYNAVANASASTIRGTGVNTLA